VVRAALAATLPAETTDLAELLTSELVTNAIRHGSGQVMLSLNCGDGVLAISVSDDAPTMPFVQPDDEPLAVGGRGVRRVCHRGSRDPARSCGSGYRPDGGPSRSVGRESSSSGGRTPTSLVWLPTSLLPDCRSRRCRPGC
jgi:hypothetical protein